MTVTAPARSNARVAAPEVDSGTMREENTKVAMPIGTLTKKIHSQASRSVRMPPSRRPNAAPPAAMPPQTPRAFVRSSPSGKVVVMIDSAAGETSAAPRPCRPRARMSIVPDCASPSSSDAKVNSAMPARNRRLRPSRSAARPPSSRKPPNISV